ncbi:hypothetical protein B5X24_HaOG215419 [Helicoverpa armigera]|nr:hypothetical protein B5X24_HaOG215419 [Helicoverpa armigera]
MEMVRASLKKNTEAYVHRLTVGVKAPLLTYKSHVLAATLTSRPYVTAQCEEALMWQIVALLVGVVQRKVKKLYELNLLIFTFIGCGRK